MGKKDVAGSSGAEGEAFSPLIDYLHQAESYADNLGYTDPAFRPAFHQFATMFIALGYIQVFGNSIDRPAWVPYMPFYLPWGSPNGDDIYRCAPVDAAGTYRLSGKRGTSLFSFITMKKNGAHLGEISSGKTLDEFDLNLLEADGDGQYSILLSTERPAGYDGSWHRLDPETTQFMYRSRTTGPGEVDATCLLERLDGSPPSTVPDAATVAQKMEAVANYAKKQVNFLIGYQNSIRDRGGDNLFIPDDQSAYGALVQQRYLLHVFTLADDEALILESALPDKCRYWSVHLFDTHFNSLENNFRQSHLNDRRVHLDADGRVRIVVSARDPGVANWLDTGGWPSAGIHWRWNDADSCPVPSVRKVRLADVAAQLPPETPRLSAAERREALHRHSAYFQTRAI